MNNLSVHDLLKPRYKVIADYPQSEFKIGDILIEQDMGATANPFFQVGKFGFPQMPSIHYPEKWPHLFKKLEWWEERKEEDMPEYVRVAPNGYVHPVKEFKVEDGYITFLHGEVNEWWGLGNMSPATKEEYLNQNKP